jgi:hypothetical protein
MASSIKPTQALSLAADSVYLSSRPLPTAPTGYYDWQVSSNPADKREGHSIVTNLLNRVSPQPLPEHFYFILFPVIGKGVRTKRRIQA